MRLIASGRPPANAGGGRPAAVPRLAAPCVSGAAALSDVPAPFAVPPSPATGPAGRLECVGDDRTVAEQPADRELLQAIGDGDETALRLLYERYGGLLLTVAHHTIGNWQAAEEAVQDVFVRCWYRADTYTATRGSVAAWLIGMTRNRSVDTLRRQAASKRNDRAAVSLDEAPLAALVGSPGMDATVDALAAREALAGLPGDERIAITLAVYGGLRQSDIAVALDAPLGTVKSWIRRGMARLRTNLQPGEGRDD